jgi:hypothetical protein
MTTFRQEFVLRLDYIRHFPWQRVDNENYNIPDHIRTWLTGWLWAISGIFAGAVLSIPIIDFTYMNGKWFTVYISVAIAIVLGIAMQYL